jgi:hypothetical protein
VVNVGAPGSAAATAASRSNAGINFTESRDK